MKRVEVGLKRGFVVTGPGISEELEPMEIDRLLVGKVIFRGGKNVAEHTLKQGFNVIRHVHFFSGAVSSREFGQRIFPPEYPMPVTT